MRKAIGAAALAVALMAAPAFAGTMGGSGDDTIVGTPSNDVLTGGPGADLIHSGKGADYVDGGTGVDICFVQPRDTVRHCEAIV
jgi:Ca2+-binding RTX toxin-like protein